MANRQKGIKIPGLCKMHSPGKKQIPAGITLRKWVFLFEIPGT